MNIKPIKLLSGSHADTGATGQGCFMNVIAYLNGESQITDKSPCVCVTIRPIAIWLNDFANEEQRQRLLPFVMRAMGTTTDDKVEMTRRIAAVVKYAEFNARLADSFAKYAAKSADAAKSAAKSAADDAAKYAADAADAAEYAAKYAKYSKSAAEYIERKEAIFQAGLDFLDEVCPPLQPFNQEILQRADRLFELAKLEEV